MPTQEPDAKPSSLSRRILLVDDDVDTLNSVGEALQVLAGAEVDAVDSGAKALAALKTFHPDAMVTDYRMPGMDGIELSKRAKRVMPGLPIIMITAFGTNDLADEARAAGVCKVFSKPPDFEGLLDAIVECGGTGP